MQNYERQTAVLITNKNESFEANKNYLGWFYVLMFNVCYLRFSKKKKLKDVTCGKEKAQL